MKLNQIPFTVSIGPSTQQLLLKVAIIASYDCWGRERNEEKNSANHLFTQ